MLGANGEMDDAIIHYREALRIDPEIARAEYILGIALAGRGRLDEMNDRRREAFRFDPEASRGSDIIFGAAVNEGFEHLHQLQRIDPEFRLSYNNLGLTPRDADRLNEAIDHFETGLAVRPRARPVVARPSPRNPRPGASRSRPIPRGRGRDPPVPRPAPPGSRAPRQRGGLAPALRTVGRPERPAARRPRGARKGPATRPRPSSSPNSAACRIDSPRPHASTPRLFRRLTATAERYRQHSSLHRRMCRRARRLRPRRGRGHARRGGSGALARAGPRVAPG